MTLESQSHQEAITSEDDKQSGPDKAINSISDNSSNPATPGVAAGSQSVSQPENSQSPSFQPSNQEPQSSSPDSQSPNSTPEQSKPSSNSEPSSPTSSPKPLKPSPRPKGVMTPHQVANLTHIPGVSRFEFLKTKQDQDTTQDLLNQQAPEKPQESLNQPSSTTDLEPTLLQEILSTNQQVYTSLQIKEQPDNTGNLIDLEHELDQGNILLPSQEEHETRTQAGYIPIIIPGHLTRESIISIFKDPQTYLNLNSQQTLQPTSPQPGQQPQQPEPDNPIWFSDQAQTDFPNTNSQINHTRPQQLYLTYFKPDPETHDAHPETKAKSAEACQQILEQEQQSNPELNLQGLTLEEYLTFQAYSKQTTKEYLDQTTWCWLLADTVPDPDPQATQPARCLCSAWFSGLRLLYVYSAFLDGSTSGYGSRFQAMPGYEETN